ncbi:Eukaryotic translation initiation factor 4B [Lecanora helva]
MQGDGDKSDAASGNAKKIVGPKSSLQNNRDNLRNIIFLTTIHSKKHTRIIPESKAIGFDSGRWTLSQRERGILSRNHGYVALQRGIVMSGQLHFHCLSCDILTHEYPAPQKAKGQKMDLGSFLTDTSLGSWADEMEDMPMPSAPSGRGGYGGDRGYNSGSGYGHGGFQDRGGFHMREQLPLPTKPPYTVHLGNMSFDATVGDVTDFFAECRVTSVRIVEDKMDGKPKGFGYAEFATLDGLKRALEFNNTQFQGRNIRVSVAEPQKERPDARDFGNWDRKGPLPDNGPRRTSDRGGFGAGRGGFDNASDAGSERGIRRPFEQNDGKVRDFGNWDRKGPLTPSLPTARSFDRPDRPVSREGPGRRNSPSWGEGRPAGSDAGSRPPRREFVERPIIERVPTAAEQDNQWRAKMKPDAPAAPPVQPTQAARSPALSNRELSTPPSPVAPAAPPASRPKLNLAKRTVSEVPTEAASAGSTDSKASPFGAAKPIDTATREKEIEEKRQIALREKKEAEEQAREAKKAAEEKEREEKRLAKEAEMAAKAEKEAATKDKPNGQNTTHPIREKPNGQVPREKETNSAPPPGKNYEILRRAANDDASAADEEADDASNADGLITEDKAIKPKEIVRDASAKNEEAAKTNGATPGATPDPSAAALEDDGWSTVSKPTKNRRAGNQASRAIAS